MTARISFLLEETGELFNCAPNLYKNLAIRMYFPSAPETTYDLRVIFCSVTQRHRATKKLEFSQHESNQRLSRYYWRYCTIKLQETRPDFVGRIRGFFSKVPVFLTEKYHSHKFTRLKISISSRGLHRKCYVTSCFSFCGIRTELSVLFYCLQNI